MEGKVQMMDVVGVKKPAALPELRPHVAKAMRNVRRAVNPICSFRNVDFCDLADELELSHGEYLLDSVDLLLVDLHYNVLSGCENVILITML